MNLALLSISGFACLFCTAAFGIDVDASVGVYYFSSNHERNSAAQLEKAEGNVSFRVERDPRAVARDLAADELAKGNVCLRQAERDLKAALRSRLIRKMCIEIFRDDMTTAQANARRKNKKAETLRCEASVEARETPSTMQTVLSLRSRVMMRERLPAKLARAGFGEEMQGWVLPTREVELGDTAESWKGVLKNHSCSVGESVLEKHLESFLEQTKEARVLLSCRGRLDRQLASLSQLQAQLTQYVPFEWLVEAGGSSAKELLAPLPASTPTMELEACRVAREEAGERMKDLRNLSEVIADHHDIPALEPANLPSKRAPASEDVE